MIAPQSLWRVPRSVDISTADAIVGQFHHVIKKTSCVVTTDMENVDEAIMGARNRLERRHAGEFTIEGTFALEGASMNHFHRAQCAGQTARHPNLAISAAPDNAQHFMIGDRRNAHVFPLYLLL